MSNVDFKAMNGPQLVAAYNEMAKRVTGVTPVTRFSNAAVGLRRCLDLAAKAAPAKAPASAPKAARKGKEETRTALGIQFGVRAGTVREKLLNALGEQKGKQVALNTLLKASYGSVNIENKGALFMVLKGIEASIKKNSLPFHVKKEKNEAKEISLGLHPAK